MSTLARPLTLRNAAGVVSAAFGALALILALGAFIGGNYAHNYVKSELGKQHIAFPDDMSESAKPLQKYAGKTVDSGPEAKAFGQYIQGHVAAATGGKTYSEASAAARANPQDQKLQEARRTALDGNLLYGTLQNSYGWWLLGSIALWASLGLLLAGLALLALGLVLTRART